MSSTDAARSIRLVCAYCGAEKTANGWTLASAAWDGLVSHGICPGCLEGHIEAELVALEAGRKARRDPRPRRLR